MVKQGSTYRYVLGRVKNKSARVVGVSPDQYELIISVIGFNPTLAYAARSVPLCLGFSTLMFLSGLNLAKVAHKNHRR